MRGHCRTTPSIRRKRFAGSSLALAWAMLASTAGVPPASAQTYTTASAVVPASGGTLSGATYTSLNTVGAPWASGELTGSASSPGGGSSFVLAGDFPLLVVGSSTAPALLSVMPALGPASGATRITLRGSRFLGIPAVTVGGRQALHVMLVDATTISAVTPPGTPGAAGVVVTTSGGRTTLADGFTYGAQWFRYFAEGAVSPFFDTRFALLNAGTAPAHATVTYLPAGRDPATAPPSESDSLAGPGAATLAPRTALASASGLAAFSTIIESDQPLATDRTMTWTPEAVYGSHAGTGVEGPSTEWFFAEGATHLGFELFFLLQNPTSLTAQVQVRFLLAAGTPPAHATYTVAPHSRTNVWVNDEARRVPGLASLIDASSLAAEFISVAHIDDAGASVAAVPIVVERAMYLGNGQGAPVFEAGTVSAGVTAPQRRWYFAEGATGDFFDEWLLVANPSVADASVVIRYLLPDGRAYRRTQLVPAASRTSIHVDAEAGLTAEAGTPAVDAGATPLASTALALELESSYPVVAERSLWWADAAGRWYEGHTASGLDTLAARWAVAGVEVEDAGTSDGVVSSYLLVANPTSTATLVTITPHCDDGAPTASRTFASRARSRLTIDLAAPAAVDANGIALDGSGFGAALLGRQCGLIVSAADGAGAPGSVVVERATYRTPAGGLLFSAGACAPGTVMR